MRCPNFEACENQAVCLSPCPVIDYFGGTLLVSNSLCSDCRRKIPFADYAICTCPQRLEHYLATRS